MPASRDEASVPPAVGSLHEKPGGRVDMLSLAFLTVTEHDRDGLTGGLLVLNANARPLEFHCTAPLKPNRAQQILYGPTLEPYLYGEQIGRTLLAKLAVPPRVVVTDTRTALATRNFIDAPTAWIVPASGAGGLETFEINGLRLAVTRTSDAEAIRVALAELPRQMDLVEPFDRIRNALDESTRPAKAA
ncbi:MAG: hypothetical protein QM811_28305 [Pirellulales bacterium]